MKGSKIRIQEHLAIVLLYNHECFQDLGMELESHSLEQLEEALLLYRHECFQDLELELEIRSGLLVDFRAFEPLRVPLLASISPDLVQSRLETVSEKPLSFVFVAVVD